MLPEVRPVAIGSARFGGGAPLALIAGPCAIETEAHCLGMARALKKIAEASGADLVFKASYDKANRTSVRSFRGPGLERGLAILAHVREETGLPVLSDVHTPAEAEAAAEALDCLQIPAFLCRQTDLLVAAGQTGRPVAVKKGPFLAPWDMQEVLAKVESTGNRNVLLTERGTSFGYNNLVSDMRALPILRGLGAPVVFDATHSVQLPGGRGSSSGGEREHVATLARAAAAAGVDGLFLEVHDAPERAPCDGPNMLPLEGLEEFLFTLLAIDRLVRA
ncbi:MAG: 3-deoxy-8-phosphooctulonate synthase [Planctomycetota bacterium]